VGGSSQINLTGTLRVPSEPFGGPPGPPFGAEGSYIGAPGPGGAGWGGDGPGGLKGHRPATRAAWLWGGGGGGGGARGEGTVPVPLRSEGRFRPPENFLPSGV
jgi:hypothetical protein